MLPWLGDPGPALVAGTADHGAGGGQPLTPTSGAAAHLQAPQLLLLLCLPMLARLPWGCRDARDGPQKPLVVADGGVPFLEGDPLVQAGFPTSARASLGHPSARPPQSSCPAGGRWWSLLIPLAAQGLLVLPGCSPHTPSPSFAWGPQSPAQARHVSPTSQPVANADSPLHGLL